MEVLLQLTARSSRCFQFSDIFDHSCLHLCASTNLAKSKRFKICLWTPSMQPFDSSSFVLREDANFRRFDDATS